MTLRELDNLVRIGKLKKEPGTQFEFDGLIHSGRMRLNDAQNDSNSIEGRFDLAYTTQHMPCVWPHYVGMVIGQTIVTLSFRYCLIPSDSIRQCGGFWLNVMTNVISRNIRVISKLMSHYSRI